jgi:hypothetical protein
MLYNNEQDNQDWEVKLVESNAVRVGGRFQQARADAAKLDERIVVILPYESELGPKAAAEGLERLQAVPIHKGVIIVPVHNKKPVKRFNRDAQRQQKLLAAQTAKVNAMMREEGYEEEELLDEAKDDDEQKGMSAADSFRRLLQQSERGTWREQKFGRLQVFYIFRHLPVPDNDRLRSILGANLQFM